MGNASSHKNGGDEEWKGPFSDEEYECLVTKYKEITTTASSVAAVNAKLTEWLALPLDDKVPEEMTKQWKQIGAAFYDLCLETQEGDAPTSGQLRLVNFVQAVSLCLRSSSQTIIRSLFRLFASKDKVNLFEDQLLQLSVACLIMADERMVKEDIDGIIHAAKALSYAPLPTANTNQSTQISFDEFVRWITGQFPLFYSVFMSWMARKSFGSLARPSYNAPRLSHKSDIISQAYFVCLSTVSTALQNSIDRLYTSSQDGLSFNRLCYHILGYTGPTLTIIRDTEGGVFGMFSDAEWKESSRFYGGNDCFLFRLQPEINIYHASANGTGENYMYLNSKGYALPHGLGMGGNTNSFRLFLSEDFDENSYTTNKCLSFEPGRLSSREHFTIEAMEVWGCGGDEGRQSQMAHRLQTADLINKARKVDKAQFMGSDFDKEFFLSKTFGHGTDQRRIAEDEQ